MPAGWFAPDCRWKPAVQSSIVLPITDNPDIRAALSDAIQACLP